MPHPSPVIVMAVPSGQSLYGTLLGSKGHFSIFSSVLLAPTHACMCIHACHTHWRGEGRNKQFHLEAEIETLSLLNVQVFMPKKKIRLHREDKGEGRQMIEISVTGMGIDL